RPRTDALDARPADPAAGRLPPILQPGDGRADRVATGRRDPAAAVRGGFGAVVMRYFGGKTRSLKWLTPIIEDALRAPHIVGYWEPFVGGASVFSAVRTDKPKIASDSCESIILLWRHLQAGGDLPDAISEAEIGRAHV